MTGQRPERPSDQLSGREAATVAGVSYSTWKNYVAAGYAPRRDGEIGNSHWWYRRTVERWKQQRPGQGARTDLHNKNKPKRKPTKKAAGRMGDRADPP